MKILLTCDPEIPVPPVRYGGVERLVSGLAQEYQAMGHEVYMIANPASTEPVKEIYGWKSTHSRGWKNVMKNAFQLRKIVREIRPDMIHSFSRLMYLYPMFLSGTKIHVLQTYGRAISQRSTDFARKICGNYIHFACCGAHMLNHIRGREDWNVVYNFTDVDLFQATDGPREYLAFLGRIEDIKGTYEAIQVSKKSGIPLIIAGNVEPEHQKYFETKVKPYVDDNLIRYIGPVDDARKQQLLGGAKAFLMPIKWEEPFGIVMIEAMACGAPVLAFRRGSVPEIVTKGVGHISSSVEEMASQVSTLDCFPPKEINDFVRNHFSRQVIASQYIDIFRQWTGK